MPSSMASTTGPFYISSYAADVILSEVRPIKLKVEALRSVNVLLDEFLYNILSTASSLSTDKLRASLLTLLPTTLGKDALLEAEVELRAYWDRTGPEGVSLEDDAKTFHLQWIFELLRLKCEAYSTLNETDEDPITEERIAIMASSAGYKLPKTALVAPAALYLTAILEALCEHILSNVGRVASRDSSRNIATLQDLFIALCEDHSIYTLFKTMKVYEQIEQLSKAPKALKVRRSKSLTPSDRTHTSSSHQDLLMIRDGSPVHSYLSSEGETVGVAHVSNSRSSSSEKSRVIKMFMINGRSSTERDRETQNGHKMSDSAVSEHSRYTTTSLSDEASASLEEFDDLMRTSSTMKVSLTPDRLKTMEAHKQDRNLRGANRHLRSLYFKGDPDPSSIASWATSRKPLLLRVDSIHEDEEYNASKPPTAFPPPRNRQTSVISPPSSPPATSRVRSISAASRILSNPSLTSASSMSGNSTQSNHHIHQGRDHFPSRKIRRNMESLDLDEVMDRSDEEPRPKTQSSMVLSPNRSGQPPVSRGTRDLIEFLAEGPPDTGPVVPPERSGFYGSPDNGKSKGSGRLQRMISRLSLNSSKGALDDSPKLKTHHSPRQTFPSNASSGSLSYLANRPIPPRPPPPISLYPISPPHQISPPPSSLRDTFADLSYTGSRSRSSSLVPKRQNSVEISTVVPPFSIPVQGDNVGRQPPSVKNGYTHNHRYDRIDGSSLTSPPRSVHSAAKVDIPTPTSNLEQSTPRTRSPRVTPASPQTRKPVPEYAVEPHISAPDAKELHRLLSRATNADECRLIFDMFLTKSGIPVERPNLNTPRSPPSSSFVSPAEVVPDQFMLETRLVEFFLGDRNMRELDVRKDQVTKISKLETTVTVRPPGEATVSNGLRMGNSIPRTSNKSPDVVNL